MLKNSFRFLNLSRHTSIINRLSTTTTEAEKEPPKKIRRRKKYDVSNEPVVNKLILKYYDNPVREIAMEYPETILVRQRKKIGTGLYIADRCAVDEILQAIKSDLRPDIPLYEANPGIGLLTRRLILETKNPLTLCEPDKICYEKICVGQICFKEIHSIINFIIFRN